VNHGDFLRQVSKNRRLRSAKSNLLSSQAAFLLLDQSSFPPQFLHCAFEKLLNIESADAPIGGATEIPHVGHETRPLSQLQNRMLATNKIRNASCTYRLRSTIGKLEATNKASDILYLFSELTVL
jgi:hypothetical protein